MQQTRAMDCFSIIKNMRYEKEVEGVERSKCQAGSLLESSMHKAQLAQPRDPAFRRGNEKTQALAGALLPPYIVRRS